MIINDDIPFGIYLHWPFCLSKCPYCDFFSKVKKDICQNDLIKEYLDDLKFYRHLSGPRKVTSVFFGGGTPSLITPQNIEKILNQIQKLWPLAENIEISLEANPNSNYPNLFQKLRQAGINRLSLGIQALNDNDLKFLGRTHNTSQALKAMEEVLQNFSNHSIDLIYARPQQQPEEWEKELQKAISFGFRHLSLYQLTIEEGTDFAKKGIEALDEESAAILYDLTVQKLSQAGYSRYEVSNFSQKGLECRHNMLYWQGDDYLGVGQGAHGRLVSEGKIYATLHRCQLEELSPIERAEELIIMGLRLKKGINKQRFQEICRLNFETYINSAQKEILLKEKLLEETPLCLRATDKGFLVLDQLIAKLIP